MKAQFGLRDILFLCAVVAALPLVAAAASGTARAAEAGSETSAELLLGQDAAGGNWTVAPAVRSDGFLRLFDVKTPYGDFQVNGWRRMNERLQEFRALQTLERMSRTEVFADALARGGLAPIRFGRDFVLDPVETTGNLISGVGRMFRNVAASVSNAGSSRDPLFDRLVGITAAERELAFELQVDPYSDFTPLRHGLEDVAHAMVAGGLTVSVAMSAIPGGAGTAVSATSRAAGFADSVYSKTSDEITVLVTEKLEALRVDEATIAKFNGNRWYSPNDQFAIAEALEKLNAADSALFVSLAADADGYDVAKFHRYRAELLANESARLGTLSGFVIVSDMAINRDAAGRWVAAFPFDVVEWTDSASGSLTRLSEELARQGGAAPRIFATTGALSAAADAELKQRGWTIVNLN